MHVNGAAVHITGPNERLLEFGDGDTSFATLSGGEGFISSSVTLHAPRFVTTSGTFAMGDSTVASGSQSVAMGYGTLASGTMSTAMGSLTIASGRSATAMGERTMALGTLSTAAGYNATASGSHSTAVGHTTVSTSFAEMAIGRFNEITSTAPSAGPDGVDGQHTWRDADAVFRVGVGSDESNRQDALTVYKDGRWSHTTQTHLSPLAHTSTHTVLPPPCTHDKCARLAVFEPHSPCQCCSGCVLLCVCVLHTCLR